MCPWGFPGGILLIFLNPSIFPLSETSACLSFSFFADDHTSYVIRKWKQLENFFMISSQHLLYALILCLPECSCRMIDCSPKANSFISDLDLIHFYLLEDIAPGLFSFLSCFTNCFLSTGSFPLAYNLVIISFFLKKKKQELNDNKIPQTFHLTNFSP